MDMLARASTELREQTERAALVEEITQAVLKRLYETDAKTKVLDLVKDVCRRTELLQQNLFTIDRVVATMQTQQHTFATDVAQRFATQRIHSGDATTLIDKIKHLESEVLSLKLRVLTRERLRM